MTRGPSADFAKAARDRVPVVFAYSGDPVLAGFGDSLGRPGRNMTGITFMAMELSAKRIEVLKELLPGAKRIALLSNPEHSGEMNEYQVSEQTAKRLGAAITRHLVRSPQELQAAYVAIQASRPDAMIVFPDALTLARRAEIAQFAAAAGIPCMYGWTEFAEAGGLISYGPGLVENFKRLALFVDKILKGAGRGRHPDRAGAENRPDLQHARGEGAQAERADVHPPTRRHGDRVKRRAFVAGLALQPLLGMTVFAQTAGKVWRVGLLSPRDEADFRSLRLPRAVPAGMRDLGYAEGRNLAMEYRYADGKVENHAEAGGRTGGGEGRHHGHGRQPGRRRGA